MVRGSRLLDAKVLGSGVLLRYEGRKMSDEAGAPRVFVGRSHVGFARTMAQDDGVRHGSTTRAWTSPAPGQVPRASGEQGSS